MEKTHDVSRDRESLLSEATLIGTQACPFVARAMIVAHLKKTALKILHIDLTDKPDWFLRQSPTGTVPALRIGGRFIFESSVIVDLIDALVGESLYPADPLDKFENKSWIEYAAAVLRTQHAMIAAGDEETFQAEKERFRVCLAKVESATAARPFFSPFFNGANMSVIDAVYAPIFYRCALLADRYAVRLLDEYPCLSRWSEALVVHPAVKAFHDDGFDAAFLRQLRERKAFLALA